MSFIKNAFKHFMKITKHKIEVGKACFRAGRYWQGLTHDLSKYSPIEFITSAKYYQGDSSPIDAEKKDKGYSYAWLHHRGRNPHHWEYWIDNLSKGGEPMIIPYKYCMEMVCDWIGAGKVYNKKNWNQQEPERFFKLKLSRQEIILHPKIELFLTIVLERFSKKGYLALSGWVTKMIYEQIMEYNFLEKNEITRNYYVKKRHI